MVARRTAPDKGAAGGTITVMMRPTPLGMTTALAASLALAAAPIPAPAQPAQSPSELRRENIRLREQIRTLEVELEASKQRIERLEAFIESLEARIAELQAAATTEEAESEPGDEPSEPETPLTDGATAGESGDGVDPEPKQSAADDPFASPGAMLRSLKREYQAAVGDLPRETDEQVERYLREARQWVRRVNLKRRKAVEWRVELLDVEVISPTEALCRFRVVDEEVASDDVVDAPFPLEIAGRHAGRVIEHPGQRLWVLEGLFAATPRFNEDRLEPGVFNAPPLVGPYTEFDFKLRVRTLRPFEGDASSAESPTG